MAARPPSRNSISKSTICESAMSSTETLVSAQVGKTASDSWKTKQLPKVPSLDDLKSPPFKGPLPGPSSSSSSLHRPAATSSSPRPSPPARQSLWRRVSSFFTSDDDEEDDQLEDLYCDNSELQTRLAKLRNGESVDIHVRLNHGPDRRGLLISSLTPFEDFVELVCAKFQAPYGSLGFQFDGEEEAAPWEQDSGRGRVSLTEAKDYAWALSMALVAIEASLERRLKRIEMLEWRREQKKSRDEDQKKKRESSIRGKGKANAFDPLNLFHLQIWCIDLVGNRHNV